LRQLPNNKNVSKENQLSENDTSSRNIISLFEQRRIKGWWPCIVELSDSMREMAVRKYLFNDF
jgi:hypothetical protein